jgi:Skp family chaperone for outer membrane proteins
MMKKIILALLPLMIFAFVAEAQSQEETSIAKELGLYVFPSEEQDKEQQELDEYNCYKWAKEQSGINPMKVEQIEAEQVDQSPDGSAVVGAAGGAAAGAAIGAIAGDAGKGAAIGAVVGGMAGRRSKVAGDAQQQQQNEQAAAAKEKELMENFNKAFAACMEGKGYTVK